MELELQKRRIKKARKEHQCSFCCNVIKKGSTYYREVFLLDRKIAQNKAHQQCIGIVDEEDRKMKIYISGGITGCPDYFKKFEDAEQALRGKFPFAEIVNPTKLFTKEELEEFKWEQFMRRDIKALLECTHIAPIYGWEVSRGALLELEIAERLDIQLILNVAKRSFS